MDWIYPGAGDIAEEANCFLQITKKVLYTNRGKLDENWTFVGNSDSVRVNTCQSIKDSKAGFLTVGRYLGSD